MSEHKLKVFLSYSNADSHLVNNFIRILKFHLGTKIHFFRDRPHENLIDSSIGPGDWLDTLKSELQSSDIVLGIITKQYLSSRWMHMEIGGSVLYNKEVIPVCFPPINVNMLPSPLNSRQAFLYTDAEITNLIQFLGKRINSSFIVDSKKVVDLGLETAENDKKNYNEILTLLSGVDSIEKVRNLLQTRKTLGDFLWKLHSKYSGTVAKKAEVISDINGHCNIVRRETYMLNSPAAHIYYQVFIDKPGHIEIKNIFDPDTNQKISSVPHLEGDVAKHISILFDSIKPAGMSFSCQIEVYAENYLSNLIENGIAQVFFRNTKQIKTISHLQTFRFPNHRIFRTMKGFISETEDPKKIGTECIPVITEDEIIFTFDCSYLTGNTGIDLLEFRI